MTSESLSFGLICDRRLSMSSKPQNHVDVFDNPKPERDFEIHFNCPEFTCLCPLTGQPDFASISIVYVPDQHCIELKSLKLYLWSYRDQGAFHEKVTNQIMDDLITAAAPRRIVVKASFLVRGGITTDVIVRHEKARLEK